MLADGLDRRCVNRQLGEVRRQLQAGTLDAEAEQAVGGLATRPAQPARASPAQTLLASLRQADAGPPASGGEATATSSTRAACTGPLRLPRPRLRRARGPGPLPLGAQVREETIA